MAAKDVNFGDKARAGMLEGVNILADAVKATLISPANNWPRSAAAVGKRPAVSKAERPASCNNQ